MAEEIERKFLVATDAWRDKVRREMRLRQGYFGGGGRCLTRVRSNGRQAWLNVKSRESGMRRLEFDYEIPLEDAEVMLKKFCDGALIDKTRYWVDDSGHTWEVDVFHGENAGLIVAEVELKLVTEAVDLPDWVGEEVTDDIRYYNASLVDKPYSRWRRKR
ncbi:MAG: CYTH domain-containing protein [Gammaproteobacteria bacterium]